MRRAWQAHEHGGFDLSGLAARAVLAIFVVSAVGAANGAGDDNSPQATASPSAAPSPEAGGRAATPHQVAVQAAGASRSAAEAAKDAQLATTKALQASKQAALASSQASTLSARGAGKSAASPLGNSAPAGASNNASYGSNPPSPSAKTSSTTLSLAKGEPNPDANVQTALFVEKLRQADRSVNRSALDADDQRRMAMANELLRGAQKSLDAKDYTAARSLASKASVILTPLIGTHSPSGPPTP